MKRKARADWIQLLQGTGLVGFGTFLTGVVLLVVWFMKRLIEIGRRQRRRNWKRRDRLDPDPYAMPLAALLAIIAMAAHSVVDFNLQMPATGWVLAALVGVAIADKRAQTKTDEKMFTCLP